MIAKTFLLIIFALKCRGIHTPEIAIIGGGIGGTTGAYYVRELFGSDVNIDVFEPHEIGGRMQSKHIFGQPHEIGAEFFHVNNIYMSYFVNLLGLEKKIIYYDKKVELWTSDGIHKHTEEDWLNIYGFEMRRVFDFLGNIMKDFMRMYNCQEQGGTATSTLSLLRAMGPTVTQTTNYSLEEILYQHGAGPQFVREIATAFTRGAYAQFSDIQALPGLISLFGMSKNFWSVEGGCQRIAEKLLERSNATLIPAAVSEVVRLSDGKFQLSPANTSKHYDMVIFANPTAAYLPVTVTLVQGKRKNSEHIVLVADRSSKIYLIRLQFSSVGELPIWKINSRGRLSSKHLSDLFHEWNIVYEKEWRYAYPIFSKKHVDMPFEDYQGLYYINNVEAITSSVEVTIMAARNVANLAYNNWFSKAPPSCE